MQARGHRPATIVVVHPHAGVLELIEQALGDGGDHVLGTCNPLEAIEVAAQLHVDVLVVEATEAELARELLTLQPDLQVVYLGAKPVALSVLAVAVVASRAERG